MKIRVIFFIIIGLTFNFLVAQEHLRVEYELIERQENFETAQFGSNVEIKMPKRFFELILNEEESIWKSIDRIDNEQNEDKGALVAVVSFPPSGDFYKNLKEKTKVKEEESFSKNYLIKDSLTAIDWKITKEKKEVLEITVQKATFTDKENGEELIAWYAPKLNFKNGPDKFWGLPGLILEIEIITYFNDNTEASETYIARNIETLKSNKKITKPTKGIVVTEEEFNSINQRNYERMREMRSGGVDVD